MASGEFELEQARTIAQLESLAADERLLDALVPAGADAAGFPSVFVDDRDGHADPQRPQFSGLAVPVAAGLEVCEGGDADRANWWPSERRCCRTCTIRWWCSKAADIIQV